MAIYKVQSGDCLNSIAAAHGMPVRKIWAHGNNSALRAKRADSNVLLPGDELFIPEMDAKSEACPTEQRHRFRRKDVPITFRLRLLENGEPRASLPYRIEIESAVRDGTTDEDGWLEERIRPDARKARLTIGDGAETYELELGRLNPVDDATGVQQRLNNLGIYLGAIDGEIGPRSREALAFFQARSRVQVTGELDDDTRAALRDQHES